jgi:8-oxo-dGTP pyrophosphatase MutT (NUDIX family)
MKTTIKVAAVISNDKGETLLIKERYDKNQAAKWNIIKGTYDNPDETIVDCIKREIKEEVGLTVTDLTLSKIYHYGDSKNPKVLFIFKVIDFNNIPIKLIKSKRRPDEDIISAKWVGKKEVNNIPKEDFVANYVWKAIEPFSSSELIEIIKIE